MRALTMALLLALSGAASAEDLFLSVSVNGIPAPGEAIEFEEEGGLLQAPPAVWSALGIVLTPEEEQRGRLSIKELGLTATIDRALMRVEIDTPPHRVPAQTLNERMKPAAAVSPTATGVLINYDVAGTWGPHTPLSLSAGHEIRTAGSWGVLSHSGQLNLGPHGVDYRRGFTTWTYDEPARQRSYQLGDIATSPTSTSSSVLMAGARIASDPSLDPSRPSFPVPVIAGVATSNSTLDAYINARPVLHQNVGVGGFSTTEYPVLRGANRVDLVLTDDYGRQTTSTQSLYLSTNQLRKGLSEWEVNIGKVRTGVTDTYTTPALSANYSRGMSDTWTLDTHVEATADHRSVGVGSRLVLGHAGSLSLGAAQSNGPTGNGRKLALEYEYTSRHWGINAGVMKQSDDWWDLTQVAGPSADLDPVGIAHVGGSFQIPNKNMTIRLNAVRLDQRDGDSRNRVDLQWNWEKPNSSWGAGVAMLDGDPQAWLTYRRSLGGSTSVSAQVSGGRGHARTELRASGHRDTGQDIVGWRARLADNGSTYGDAELNWRTPHTEASARVDVYDGDLRLSGRVRGALWLGSGAHARMQPIVESFAVVKVPGVPGVPVRLENRPVGVTDHTGALVVGPLRELEQNRITIDIRAMPPDVEVATTEIMVVPNRRHGALVVFPVKTMSARLFKIDRANGVAPAGAQITSEAESTILGHDGELFLEHAEAGQNIELAHGNERCTITIPTPLPAFDQVPTLLCQ